MKLSEHIRKGMEFGLKQCRGSFFFWKKEEESLQACAVGQALLGAGIVSLKDAKYYTMYGHFPSTEGVYGILGRERWQNKEEVNLTISLNDHGRSLDEIIEELEKKGF